MEPAAAKSSGGHGIAAVVAVPDTTTDRGQLKALFQDIRRAINSRFVGFAAYKSSHSFIVLVMPTQRIHVLFGDRLRTERQEWGFNMNIIQGVILVDTETREVVGDYTRPAQHKREYEAVLAAATNAIQ